MHPVSQQNMFDYTMSVVLQNEYLSLVEQCMDFACEMMDLCRGTQEVEAVLSEGSEEGAKVDPLARLKMAIEYEEKKVHFLFYILPWGIWPEKNN